MGIEIERKFLVTDDSYKKLADECVYIVQGYLGTDPDRTVRVRIAGECAWLTVKSRNDGCVRSEWEYSIPAADARDMLALCRCTLAKTRYRVGRWEIDEFHGRHKGLVLAEIELATSDEKTTLPSFVGEEVTGDSRYYNSNLSAE